MYMRKCKAARSDEMIDLESKTTTTGYTGFTEVLNFATSTGCRTVRLAAVTQLQHW